MDLSSPQGRSVNDGISSSLCSLSYASVDDTVNIITMLGRGTSLIKINLSNAYRMVPVHSVDQPLLGIRWRGETFIDRALPFGLCSDPKVFIAVADFLAWVLFCEGIQYVIHYLDDFLILVPLGVNALLPRQIVESTFGFVNAPVTHHKTECPSTSLTFLGIHIDSIQSQLLLPREKRLTAYKSYYPSGCSSVAVLEKSLNPCLDTYPMLPQLSAQVVFFFAPFSPCYCGCPVPPTLFG